MSSTSIESRGFGGIDTSATNIDGFINRGGLSISNAHVEFSETYFKAVAAKRKAEARARAIAKEKARLAALQKQRAAEAARIAHFENLPKPVYHTSGCTTYHSTGALEQLIMHESGGNTCATNAGGCFGLLQACPGAPLREACGGNPTCQIAWFIKYKTGGRSWEQIWSLWQRQGWW